VLRDLQAAVMILVGAKEQLASDFALSAHEQQLEQDCASSHLMPAKGGKEHEHDEHPKFASKWGDETP